MNSTTGSPANPRTGLRNRNNTGLGEPSIPAGGAESPTLTSSSETSPQHGTSPKLQLSDSMARSSFRTAVTVNPSTTRKIVVRSDPAMISCFDPVTEKELYDLWAPKG
ncbi:hypothetical protein PLEOSDRAFT_157121 [Pleurotus ostreatus PC15]|uniref:Uncharacterized protein n=2 Tax=Pleurotus TaxID=5320 RepID=A0A067P0L6_PLEO1|nr:hypothetical protein CCMSSC00406_0000947 [Pleurotus cornucopiae]KDQ29401.1 hypothetical protein PLEOSDRAFT_157121 [Pleurotus ostreatus PC15]